jgi:hypothetical protein
MKTLLSTSIIVILFCTSIATAQQQYTVDGNQYTLKTEVEGPLTLLWNTIDGEYRFFSKKGNEIRELKNTKVNGTYQEEYKKVLEEQTQDSPKKVEKVKLILGDLRDFYIGYNKQKDANYTYDKPSISLDTRLGAFAGVTNSVFTENPTNETLAVAGIDFEIIDNVRLKRHAVVLRFTQIFENSDYKFSSSQLSLNYRFKFIKSEKFDVFINAKFVSYTYTSKEFSIVEPDPNNEGEFITRIEESTGGSFQAPAAFGIGADYKIGNGYLTFSYNDIIAAGVDSNGETPLDFTLGYKFNL